jgi:hypothetical protein
MKTVKEFEQLIHHGKHFCILPWIHFHAWPDGRVMPCCVADSSKPVAIINENESIISMMNSDKYKKMRVAMLKDEPLEACQRCYDLELTGTWTLRQSHNTNQGVKILPEINATKEDGSIEDFKMRYMDIRFSNICNMKCRSCGPSCSSLWAQEYKDRYGEARLKNKFGIEEIVVSNNQSGEFFEKLKPYLHDVNEVYFAGGEALITQEHYDCLDYWIKHGLTNKVHLTYTTNFSSLKFKDKDLVGYWKKFPQLTIWASLDAEGALAETMRKGTDWDRIVNNIRYLKNVLPHAKFQITPTISIWNVFNFPDFFDYMIAEGFIDLKSAPRFNTATNPWYANIMILPESVKQRLTKKYLDYAKKYSSNKAVADGFYMIKHSLNSGDENKGGIQEFIKFNDELDQIRNERLLDVVPELEEVYQWAKR